MIAAGIIDNSTKHNKDISFDDYMVQANGVVGLSMSADEIQKIIESRIREKVDEEFAEFQNQSVKNSRHYDPRMQEIVEDQIRRTLIREFYPKMSEYIKEAMISELPKVLRLAVYDYFPDLPKDGDE